MPWNWSCVHFLHLAHFLVIIVPPLKSVRAFVPIHVPVCAPVTVCALSASPSLSVSLSMSVKHIQTNQFLYNSTPLSFRWTVSSVEEWGVGGGVFWGYSVLGKKDDQDRGKVLWFFLPGAHLSVLGHWEKFLEVVWPTQARERERGQGSGAKGAVTEDSAYHPRLSCLMQTFKLPHSAMILG
jgi:hypothetical protein